MDRIRVKFSFCGRDPYAVETRLHVKRNMLRSISTAAAPRAAARPHAPDHHDVHEPTTRRRKRAARQARVPRHEIRPGLSVH